jgi:hypothetical protein
MTRLTRRFALALFALFLVPAAALAEAKSPEIWTDMHGQALKGYDAVAYHLERRPVKGDEKFMVEWKGAKWLFSSAQNRDRFLADPERWAPQYGGYCAWGIATDKTVGINPTIFRIFDDKLYLNLNMKVHKTWLANRHGFIAEANEKWPAVLEFKR